MFRTVMFVVGYAAAAVADAVKQAVIAGGKPAEMLETVIVDRKGAYPTETIPFAHDERPLEGWGQALDRIRWMHREHREKPHSWQEVILVDSECPPDALAEYAREGSTLLCASSTKPAAPSDRGQEWSDEAQAFVPAGWVALKGEWAKRGDVWRWLPAKDERTVDQLAAVPFKAGKPRYWSGKELAEKVSYKAATHCMAALLKLTPRKKWDFVLGDESGAESRHPAWRFFFPNEGTWTDTEMWQALCEAYPLAEDPKFKAAIHLKEDEETGKPYAQVTAKGFHLTLGQLKPDYIESLLSMGFMYGSLKSDCIRYLKLLGEQQDGERELAAKALGIVPDAYLNRYGKARVHGNIESDSTGHWQPMSVDLLPEPAHWMDRWLGLSEKEQKDPLFKHDGLHWRFCRAERRILKGEADGAGPMIDVHVSTGAKEQAPRMWWDYGAFLKADGGKDESDDVDIDALGVGRARLGKADMLEGDAVREFVSYIEADQDLVDRLTQPRPLYRGIRHATERRSEATWSERKLVWSRGEYVNGKWVSKETWSPKLCRDDGGKFFDISSGEIRRPSSEEEDNGSTVPLHSPGSGVIRMAVTRTGKNGQVRVSDAFAFEFGERFDSLRAWKQLAFLTGEAKRVITAMEDSVHDLSPEADRRREDQCDDLDVIEARALCLADASEGIVKEKSEQLAAYLGTAREVIERKLEAVRLQQAREARIACDRLAKRRKLVEARLARHEAEGDSVRAEECGKLLAEMAGTLRQLREIAEPSLSGDRDEIAEALATLGKTKWEVLVRTACLAGGRSVYDRIKEALPEGMEMPANASALARQEGADPEARTEARAKGMSIFLGAVEEAVEERKRARRQGRTTYRRKAKRNAPEAVAPRRFRSGESFFQRAMPSGPLADLFDRKADLENEDAWYDDICKKLMPSVGAFGRAAFAEDRGLHLADDLPKAVAVTPMSRVDAHRRRIVWEESEGRLRPARLRAPVEEKAVLRGGKPVTVASAGRWTA